LEDEAGVDKSYPEIGHYRFLLQLLTSEDEPGVETLIRAAYYRRPPKSDRYFASQTSLTAGRSVWVALLAEAMKKDWFRSLVEEARAVSGGTTAEA
jgi:hypothetical protein